MARGEHVETQSDHPRSSTCAFPRSTLRSLKPWRNATVQTRDPASRALHRHHHYVLLLNVSLHVQLEKRFRNASSSELATTKETTVETAHALVGTSLVPELDVDFALRVSDVAVKVGTYRRVLFNLEALDGTVLCFNFTLDVFSEVGVPVAFCLSAHVSVQAASVHSLSRVKHIVNENKVSLQRRAGRLSSTKSAL